MVWGCFSGAGLGLLVPMKGSLIALAYQSILDNHAQNFVGTVWGWGFLFQHDCTLVHKARSVKTLLSELGVEELDCPV